MEEIGGKVPVKQREEVEVVKDATHFDLLQVVFKPPSHEVDAEVSLSDVDGNAIGGARWIQLNPLEIDERQGTDNWAEMAKMTLKDLGAKVKERLKSMEF